MKLATKKTPVKPQYKSIKARRKTVKPAPDDNTSAQREVAEKPKQKFLDATRLAPYQFGAPGVVNHGRPKGSRNRFAEAFVADFLSDWETHGAKALADCRACDPAAYLKVAATLLPKDLNINATEGATLDRLLDQFNDEQLRQLIGALAGLGSAAPRRTKTIEGEAAKEPD